MSKSRYALLGMLSIRPSTGYEIKRELKKAYLGFWNESYGQIYPQLKKLVADGLATVEEVERDGGTNKKIYTITDAGHDVIQRWLRHPSDTGTERHETMLKVFFGASTSRALTISQIEAMQRYHRDLLDELEQEVAEFDPDADERHAFWELAARHEQLRHETSIAWCEEALEVLEMLDT